MPVLWLPVPVVLNDLVKRFGKKFIMKTEGRCVYALECNDLDFFEKMENAYPLEADNFKSKTHISLAIQPTFSLKLSKVLIKPLKKYFFKYRRRVKNGDFYDDFKSSEKIQNMLDKH